MSGPAGATLVVRLGGADEVLVTGPAVRAVAAGGDRVVFLAGPRGSVAAELLPGVDEVVRWEASRVAPDCPPLAPAHAEALLNQLADLHVDRALVFTSSHQSARPMTLLLRMAGVGWVGAICEDPPGSLLDLSHHADAGIPEPQRALSLAQAAGYRLPDGDDGALRIRRTPLPHRLFCRIGRRPYLAYHPGAAVPARRPSAAHSAHVVAALAGAGHRVVVTGGAGERALTAAVAGAAAVDLGGETSLPQLAAVFAGAQAVIVPNTGPAHLAAAVGVPVVSLFAPVVAAEQWAPVGTRVALLGDQYAACRGTRARTCPVAGHPCLDGVTADEVLTALARLTTTGGPP